MVIYDSFIRQSRQFTTRYAIKQYLLATLLCLVFSYTVYHSLFRATENPKCLFFICTWFFLNTLLFPFARYSTDSLIGYILEGNYFNISPPIRYFFYALYLALCWAYAVILAPVGIIVYALIKLKKIDQRYYY